MATFVRNPAWLQQWMRSQELAKLVDESGERVLVEAKKNAAEHVDTGAFERSISKRTGKYSTGRPYARIASDDPAALSKEFGTSRSSAVRALGRAVRSI